MKALAISFVAGAALCSAVAVPASAVPMSNMGNLAAAAEHLAPGEAVRYVRNHYRYRQSFRGYGGYDANCYGYGYGPSSPCYP
jgi:hypothetical protein